MIKTKNLVKRFDEDTYIRYKDLVFETGKSYVLLGASGCGKSTLLNMLAGVITPSEGQIFFDGCEVSSLSQKQKDRFRIEKIGYIFQDFKLIEEMTVEDNIDVLKLEGVKTGRMDEVLAFIYVGKPAAEEAIPAEVQALLDARAAARTAKDWAASDQIRDQLKGMGWEVKDTKQGQKVQKL